MRSTPALMRLASTKSGMRRILKRPIPTVQYIRQAIAAGVYLGPGEDRATLQKRNRIQQYPIEYQILALNPPLPDPPRIPKKVLRQMEIQQKKKTKTDRLVQSYLKKNLDFGDNSEKTVDDYYRRLLGIAAPEPTTVMGQKSSLLNKAYVVAMKQQELMRSSTTDLNEADSMALVEQLLADEVKQERHVSRQVQRNVQHWKNSQTNTKQQQEQHDQQDKTTFTTDFTALDEDQVPNNTHDAHHDTYKASPNNAASSVPSILHSKPRTIRGMTLWSKRLQAVPYRDWTIGASVALDHFVARSILDISEHSWETLLEGTPTDNALQSIGRDIVMTRRSLFPETAMAEMQEEQEAAEEQGSDLDDNDDDDNDESADKSIDELLAKLGGFGDDDNDSNDVDDQFSWKEATTATERNDKIAQLSDELQEWRRKHHDETTFDDWSPTEKTTFDRWLREYVTTLQPDNSAAAAATASLDQIDLVETRNALLAAPPMTKEESNSFWDSIRDETEAELFLQSLEKETTNKTSPFWNLDYRTQVQRLAAIGGHLRPLLDETVDPKTRVAFMERHSNKLLEGLPLEHLVRDAGGVISGAELRKFNSSSSTTDASLTQGVADTDRFSIQTLPYGTNDKALALFQEWNRLKAGRARYEEHLFSKGKLGLRYSDETAEDKKKNKNNDDDDDY